MQTVVLLFISFASLAQKPITPDVDALKLHLSSFKDFDKKTKQLVEQGYQQVSWPISLHNQGLKNTAYKLVKDSIENILEIIHGDNKEVFEVNLYIGFTDKKWKAYTSEQKMNVGKNMFFNVRNMINKEYGTDEKGQARVSGNYKETDYDIAEKFLKGLDEQKLGYFVSWGPFMQRPIELENYSAKYVVVTVTEPKAKLDYFKAKKH